MPEPKSSNKGKAAPAAKSAAAAASSTAAATTNGTEAADATTSESATNNPQFLPPNEAKLLAQVFQLYEDKQYAASVETADVVLAKYPNNAREHQE